MFHVPRYVCLSHNFQHSFSPRKLIIERTFLGLFNALNGLGAGGQVDDKTSANSNAAVYGTFAGGAFFAGYDRTTFLIL